MNTADSNGTTIAVYPPSGKDKVEASRMRRWPVHSWVKRLFSSCLSIECFVLLSLWPLQAAVQFIVLGLLAQQIFFALPTSAALLLGYNCFKSLPDFLNA